MISSLNLLPAADFKYSSLLRASVRVLKDSLYKRFHGLFGFVDFTLPALCSFNLSSVFWLKPIYCELSFLLFNT